MSTVGGSGEKEIGIIDFEVVSGNIVQLKIAIVT
jgi:hypothetical protein